MPRIIKVTFVLLCFALFSDCAPATPPISETPNTESSSLREAYSDGSPPQDNAETPDQSPKEQENTTQPEPTPQEIAPEIITEPSRNETTPDNAKTDTTQEPTPDSSTPENAMSDSSTPDTAMSDNPTSDNTMPEPPWPACISSTGKDLCDDGDDCNGRERCDRSSGNCIMPTTPTCPTAPAECQQAGGSSQPKTNMTTPATPITGFRLRDQNTWTTKGALISKLGKATSYGLTKVTFGDVLKDLNRTATKVSAVPDVSCIQSGFKWDLGDTSVDYWYPQGIAGSGTANSTGLYNGRRILIVSWYHKPANDPSTNTNKGVRISIVDITSMSAIKYRHVLLVDPTTTGRLSYNYSSVKIHAGGLVWVGNYLYVPDTENGFRVFDLNNILKIKTVDPNDKNKMGLTLENRSYIFKAYGYQYVLPQVNAYTLCPGSCCARFSFSSLSIAQKPYSLLSGEYTSSDQRGRLHRWPLNPTTGRLQTINKTVQATEVLFGGTRKMQGAVAIGQDIWISSSQPKSTSPTSPGSLVRGQRNKTRLLYRFPYPPEDMHHDPKSNQIWSHTENPNKRYVFSVSPTSFGPRCP